MNAKTTSLRDRVDMVVIARQHFLSNSRSTPNIIISDQKILPDTISLSPLLNLFSTSQPLLQVGWRQSSDHVCANSSVQRTRTNLARETFENIYLDLSKQPGRCRLADSGLGWKPSGGSEPFTLEGKEVAGAQWSRASKGYELKLITRGGDVIQLDGFEQEVRG